MAANPNSDGKTLDPVSSGTRPPSGDGFSGTPDPILEILFHSDLNRIGETVASGLFVPRQAIAVGRLQPQFGESAESDAQSPLSDPCVSREQFSLTWWPSERAFALMPSEGRRPLKRFTVDGEEEILSAPISRDTILSIGDRILLLATSRMQSAQKDSPSLTGQSESIARVRSRIVGAARSDGTVLVYGESGVGKELVARSIHQASDRRKSPLVVVNCAAIPENLLESELFGHVRGAFTGATRDKEGFFSAAGAGTLFLDEIGELPLQLQSKLLRVLQERKICPVGAVREHPIRARIITATNRDLRKEVASGRFREDLYYRLNTLSITVPSLRERRVDIPLLFKQFFAQATERHPELVRFWRPVDQRTPPVPMELFLKLIFARWPGNVRQLRNIVERLATANLGECPFVVPEDVSEELDADRDNAAGFAEPADASMKGRRTGTIPNEQQISSSNDRYDGSESTQISEARLLELLSENDYVQSRVARILRVSHTTVDRWMREYRLTRPRDLTRDQLLEAAKQADYQLEQMAERLKTSKRGLKLRLVALGIDLADKARQELDESESLSP